MGRYTRGGYRGGKDVDGQPVTTAKEIPATELPPSDGNIMKPKPVVMDVTAHKLADVVREIDNQEIELRNDVAMAPPVVSDDNIAKMREEEGQEEEAQGEGITTDAETNEIPPPIFVEEPVAPVVPAAEVTLTPVDEKPSEEISF